MSYRELFYTGSLARLRQRLFERLRSCDLCPRACGIDRVKDDKGFCNTGRYAVVDGSYLHYEEEAELVGTGGSGTIFFSYCNLGCCYCQNHTLSHSGEGTVCSAQALADRMLALQAQGAENINLVTPTHVVAQIVEALLIAIPAGLRLPLVYNSGGYDDVSTLKLLKGIFDIYMPDIKYSDNAQALKFSRAPDYWEIVRPAVCEMHDQVGALVCAHGSATTGVLIRHLVLPHDLAGSQGVFTFIRENLPVQTYVNIMDQYYPCFRARDHEELSRRLLPEEYRAAVRMAENAGLKGARITRSHNERN